MIGPNGSGKTTTGKIVLNIIEPDEGTVKINTSRVAYVPQKINIDWAIPLRVIDFMNMTSKLDKFEIKNCLQLTGVDHLTYKNLLKISGREFQRVMIAREIAKKEEALFNEFKAKQAFDALDESLNRIKGSSSVSKLQ